MKSIIWFRNDLRLDDNPSLREACKNSSELHAIFLYSYDQLKKHNEANVKIDFLIKNLQCLDVNLQKLNIPLTIINSEGFEQDPDIILNLAKERNVEKVFINKQFGNDEQNRDKRARELLNAANIKTEFFNDQIVYEAGSIRTGQDNPYSVFTPFKRKWVESFDMEFLDIDFDYAPQKNIDLKSNFDGFDFKHEIIHKVDMSLWPAGEEHAKNRLVDFLENRAGNYSKDRNDPIKDGTSRMSPYLALGVISSKRCILEGLKLNNFEFNSGNSGITKWIDEIVWREFYRNIMFSFPKVGRNQPFQDFSKSIQWRFEETELHAWKTGMTGFPIIDAAMRQLLHEGWMHNRLRMVVAMFFTKNMLHDWRLGEAYFMQNLIDGDFSSNNGGWQWSSSTGTDAAPYFRIFNPITQSTNFDKEGLFIKKYVPELKGLDKSVIHDPPEEHRKYCGYPDQILDLKTSRLRAIDAFKAAKS
ncbi:DNA photolyase family protein [Gammaproteobacteria bacterium]|nr:DNA photolyase family protein [Gammaproteobacteria bacterium]